MDAHGTQPAFVINLTNNSRIPVTISSAGVRTGIWPRYVYYFITFVGGPAVENLPRTVGPFDREQLVGTNVSYRNTLHGLVNIIAPNPSAYVRWTLRYWVATSNGRTFYGRPRSAFWDHIEEHRAEFEGKEPEPFPSM